MDTQKRRVKTAVAAIFVHAGAGYHSSTNEKAHLQACCDAARTAMRFLRSGADATVAVEVAIRCLEDREITNSGFGSNLNIDGVVEGDATIVDHLGRSGACGATPAIRNPISLAKMILDASIRPLSLCRVPPNLLVGTGAVKFAEEHGMPIVRNEMLVSKNAKERFVRWLEELKEAEALSNRASISEYCSYLGGDSSNVAFNQTASTFLTSKADGDSVTFNYTHTGQKRFPAFRTTSRIQDVWGPNSASGTHTPVTHPPWIKAMQGSDYTDYSRPMGEANPGEPPSSSPALPTSDLNESLRPGDELELGDTSAIPRSPPGNSDELPNADHSHRSKGLKDKEDDDVDMVDDTVGAIAIDVRGHIAAGSSSGGIGMKHEGRVGPAALAGIGTAVIPVDVGDGDAVSVAAVTSGTGEHMATSFAALKCAQRLYHGRRRGPAGQDIEDSDEDAIVDSFVTDDFMGHPGVECQPTSGAIGIVAVKQTNYGYYFYFAHNTDSFALASMASTEPDPLCTMSRMGSNRHGVVRGGRKIRTS